jgi:hypothetical protein
VRLHNLRLIITVEKSRLRSSTQVRQTPTCPLCFPFRDWAALFLRNSLDFTPAIFSVKTPGDAKISKQNNTKRKKPASQPRPSPRTSVKTKSGPPKQPSPTSKPAPKPKI